jgi:hypothetical protein
MPNAEGRITGLSVSVAVLATEPQAAVTVRCISSYGAGCDRELQTGGSREHLHACRHEYLGAAALKRLRDKLL